MVRVTPRASRDEILGWEGDVLRVRLRAPPVEGRANEALVRLLASCLGVPPSAVGIVSGQAARTKRISVRGIGAEVLRRTLGAG